MIATYLSGTSSKDDHLEVLGGKPQELFGIRPDAHVHVDRLTLAAREDLHLQIELLHRLSRRMHKCLV